MKTHQGAFAPGQNTAREYQSMMSVQQTSRMPTPNKKAFLTTMKNWNKIPPSLKPSDISNILVKEHHPLLEKATTGTTYERYKKREVINNSLAENNRIIDRITNAYK